jgi:hypothetical protein
MVADERTNGKPFRAMRRFLGLWLRILLEYVIFCLYGTGVCAVLGGLALIVRYSVPLGFVVLILGITALCVLPLFFKWLRKMLITQGPALEYVIGGIFLVLIAASMLLIQSHFYPQ